MKNFKHRKSRKKERSLYKVSDLYVLSTQRMVRAIWDDIQYINQCYIGIKRNGKYYELHSNVLFSVYTGPYLPTYEKPFLFKAIPLSHYTKLETIDEKGLFYLLNTINAIENEEYKHNRKN